MNQKEEKWEEEFEEDFGYMNDGGFIDMSQQYYDIKTFIKERFVYKPDLIALVEGVRPSHDNPDTGNADEWYWYKQGFKAARAALKDTLSNKE